MRTQVGKHFLKLMTTTLAVCVLAGAAMAHGDKKHVMGILQSVSAESVSVKQGDGKIAIVKLAPTTMYVLKSANAGEGKPAKFADIAVGQRVVIHATPKGNDLVADEVRFAPATAPEKPATKAKQD